MIDNKETYNVCHTCQAQGLRNCSEFDKCGNTKTYPKTLRDNVIMWHKSNMPVSVIAEKSYDAGATHQDKIAVDRTVEEVVKLIEEHFKFNHVENVTTLLKETQNLKK